MWKKLGVAAGIINLFWTVLIAIIIQLGFAINDSPYTKMDEAFLTIAVPILLVCSIIICVLSFTSKIKALFVTWCINVGTQLLIIIFAGSINILILITLVFAVPSVFQYISSLKVRNN